MTDDPKAGAHEDSDGMPDDESLRRLYHTMPKLEPPVEIDNAILAAARGQGARRRSLRSRALVRWGVPLAAAASILVTFALTRLEPKPREVGVHAVDTMESRAKSDDEFLADAPRADSGRPSVAAAPAAAPPPPAVAATQPAAAPSSPSPLAPSPAPPDLRSRAKLRDESAPGAASDLAATESAPLASPAEQRSGDVRANAQIHGGAALAKQAPQALSVESDDARMAAAPEEPAESEASQTLPWPFGLEPGLAETDACRRIAAATAGRCEFRAGNADVAIAPVRAVDRGAWRGRSARRIVLHARGGKLTGMDLWLDGAGEVPVHVGTP